MTLKLARFAYLTVLFAALLLAMPVQSRAETQTANADTAKDAPALDVSSDPATEMDGLETGSIHLSPAEERKQRFNDCMSIWEPATHMTKREWRRTCNNQLTEEPNL